MLNKFALRAITGFLAFVLSISAVCHAQQSAGLDKRAQGQIADMMRDAYNEVKKHYYDPKLQGLDWDARFKQYSARIANAPDLGEGFRTVEAFLAGLKDSHTYFIPPDRMNRYEPGYRYGLVGNSCFITEIRPKADAESKLHIGDQVMKMNGFTVDRNDYYDARYYFNILAPQSVFELGVRSPAGEDRKVTVNVNVTHGKPMLDFTDATNDYWDEVRRSQDADHVMRQREVEVGDVTIWKFPEFFFNIDDVEKFIGIARKHQTLILDLRGNGGGATDTLKLMVGSLFDHEVKIADQVSRKDSKPMIAKPHGQPFKGKLIVLVDADSASAAELLARVVQLEHRGTVIGDRTAGAVMEAMPYFETQGADTKIEYEFSVTMANLIMTDGKSLEKTGVTPDEVVLPTGADLAAGRDPVLARAADLAGAKLDAVAAGKLFPYEWLPM